MPRVALVTCRVLPEPDPDQDLTLHALREQGLDTQLLAWDDVTGDPAAFDLCVLRSCWTYHERPEAFLAWATRAATESRLLNPLEVVRWNLHKRYLRDLQEIGVPIVPTAWFGQGERADLHATMKERGWHDVVIKPAVSAASYRTRRFQDPAAGQSFLDDLRRDRDAMVQQYMPSVERDGERALVHVDGELTHAVIKRPRFDGHDESVSDGVVPTEEDRAIAAAALGVVVSPLLYARVDVVRDEEGALVVSELELMEPSLFFVQHPPALARFVRAVDAACL